MGNTLSHHASLQKNAFNHELNSEANRFFWMAIFNEPGKSREGPLGICPLHLTHTRLCTHISEHHTVWAVAIHCGVRFLAQGNLSRVLLVLRIEPATFGLSIWLKAQKCSQMIHELFWMNRLKESRIRKHYWFSVCSVELELVLPGCWIERLVRLTI